VEYPTGEKGRQTEYSADCGCPAAALRLQPSDISLTLNARTMWKNPSRQHLRKQE